MENGERVTRVLLAAGWTDGCRVDPTDGMQALGGEGFLVFPAVRDFLAEYGGLRIPIEYPEETGWADDELILDAELVAERVVRENVDYVSQWVGVELCPVGVLDGGFSIFLMDGAGRFFLRTQNSLQMLGLSFPEALEEILSARFGESIPLAL
jgi:hypothetical protein